MNSRATIWLLAWGAWLWLACGETIPPLPDTIESVHKVELKQFGNRFSLYRDGKPYFIRGAAGTGAYMDILHQAGGNSLRTWNTENLDSLLEVAQALDLSITVGLYVRPERHGMNYLDTASIHRQRERIAALVNRYKDHPAVLMWGVGNEADMDVQHPEALWREINYLAGMIHQMDPNHPTTTMIRPNPETTSNIHTYAPEIDIISFNVFGGLGNIPDHIRRFWWNCDKPYIISEWGGQGWWECKMTDWQAPTEMLNRQKVPFYQDRYLQCMAKDSARCLGSYVFYWGQKQERTHTWFSMFLETGEKTSMVDMMQHLWTGTWPANRAPYITDINVNHTFNSISRYINPGESYPAWATAEDPEGDSLSYHWEIRPEGEYMYRVGGELEPPTFALPGLVQATRVSSGRSEIMIQAPDSVGAYRLFLRVSDGKGSAAAANAPFFVIGNSVD